MGNISSHRAKVTYKEKTASDKTAVWSILVYRQTISGTHSFFTIRFSFKLLEHNM